MFGSVGGSEDINVETVFRDGEAGIGLVGPVRGGLGEAYWAELKAIVSILSAHTQRRLRGI
jgi:hypothetical protein